MLMYAKQVGKQVALVMDKKTAEELYARLKGSVLVVLPVEPFDEIYEALGPIMEG